MIVTTEQDWVFFTHSGRSLDQGLNTIPSWKPNDLAICAKYWLCEGWENQRVIVR